MRLASSRIFIKAAFFLCLYVFAITIVVVLVTSGNVQEWIYLLFCASGIGMLGLGILLKRTIRFKQGDVLASPSDSGFGIVRIVAIDWVIAIKSYSLNIYGLRLPFKWRNRFPVLGCAMGDKKYPSIKEAKEAFLKKTWVVKIGHVPIKAETILEQAKFIGYQPIGEHELEGYHMWKEAFSKGEAGFF